jgi:hypothetical protein
MNYKKKSVLVVDNGLFLHFAETLAESFGKVYYWSPWVTAFPKSNAIMVGQGIPGITRVKHIWDVADDVDLFVFLDIGYGSLQMHLVNQGKRVWGPRMGEDLELNRIWAKQKAEELGVPVGPYAVITGIDALREYLTDNPDVFVKLSTLRGDTETFHSANYDLIEPRLDQLEWTLGVKKNWTEFVVEDAIHDAVEIGCDRFVIDGKQPKNLFLGVESKDKAYVGGRCLFKDLPPSLQDCSKRLAPYFKEVEYRGFFSDEVRVKGDEYYLIDPCCRLPSPPSEMYGTLVSNWADIIWEGAAGVLVEPEYTANCAAVLVLCSEWAMCNWQPVAFPDAVKDFVRLKNYAIIEGNRYVIPQTNIDLDAVGAVVGLGDSPETAIRNCLRNCEQVEGYNIDYTASALDDALAAYSEVMEDA